MSVGGRQRTEHAQNVLPGSDGGSILVGVFYRRTPLP